MPTRNTLIATAILTIGLLSTTTASAALESRLNGQAVYDTDRNITWLANANLAATNTFGVSGIYTGGPGIEGAMTWNTANLWVGAMNENDYLGFNDWRLPTTLVPDSTCTYGFVCTGSEMGHLFYDELGGVPGISINTAHNASYDLFNNVQGQGYWSGTDLLPHFSSGDAWFFDFYDGTQKHDWKSMNAWGWAVRTGDVAAVPEPEAWGLMLTGVSLVGWTARRRLSPCSPTHR